MAAVSQATFHASLDTDARKRPYPRHDDGRLCDAVAESVDVHEHFEIVGVPLDHEAREHASEDFPSIELEARLRVVYRQAEQRFDEPVVPV